jgi:exodeoxyribonuclease V
MSESFTPSDLQANAIRAIKNWFLDRTAEQQVFRVFGYAGTGKTTITVTVDYESDAPLS